MVSLSRRGLADLRLVFFFKQKTAYDMDYCDWSSDVCSSDLIGRALGREGLGQAVDHVLDQIGRASCRERV